MKARHTEIDRKRERDKLHNITCACGWRETEWHAPVIKNNIRQPQLVGGNTKHTQLTVVVRLPADTLVNPTLQVYVTIDTPLNLVISKNDLYRSFKGINNCIWRQW